MLGGMSDPQQQPSVPPYSSGQPQPYPAPQAPPPGYIGAPAQPVHQPIAPAPTGTPAQAYPAASAPATATNAPGRIGFILGLAGIVVGFLFSLIAQFTLIVSGYRHYESYSALYGVGNFLALLLSIGALVFGIVGLRRAGAPLALAGIATGLGIAGVSGALLGYLLVGLNALGGALA